VMVRAFMVVYLGSLHSVFHGTMLGARQSGKKSNGSIVAIDRHDACCA